MGAVDKQRELKLRKVSHLNENVVIEPSFCTMNMCQ